MVHAADTAADFAAVMCAVWFPIIAGGAVDWNAKGIANEDVFRVETIYARGRGNGAIQNCGMVQSYFFFSFFLLGLGRGGTLGNVSWICLDYLEDSEVGYYVW